MYGGLQGKYIMAAICANVIKADINHSTEALSYVRHPSISAVQMVLASYEVGAKKIWTN